MDINEIRRKLHSINWNFDFTIDYSSDIIYPFDCRKHFSYPATFIPEIPFTLIEILSQKGDTILDPFGGIGTTFVQSLLLERNPISCDINPVSSMVCSSLYDLLNPAIDREVLKNNLLELSYGYDENVDYTLRVEDLQKELEEWYSGIDCPATAQLNSQMYPVLIDSSLGVKRQFSIYDIAGEMFDGFTADSEVQQQQFHYCDGLLFLIDPFSSGDLRMNKINAGEDVSDFSDMAVEDVATNFINYLIRTGHAKANSRCNIPIAILIAKADIKEVKREIGPAKINSIFRNNTEQYGTYENARDSVCRQFLIDIGLAATVDNLETQFSNLHYFPVSAMGHSADGTPYEPWGIMDAIEWMLPLADKELSDLITPPAVVSQ